MKKFITTITSKYDEFTPYLYECEALSHNDACVDIARLCSNCAGKHSKIEEVVICVKVTNENWQSLYAKDGLRVQYKFGEWVESPVGKLFVFKDAFCAKEWIDRQLTDVPSRIFLCEGVNVQIPSQETRLPVYHLDKEIAIRYWRNEVMSEEYKSDFPDNTLLADKVKLIQEIQYVNFL